MAEESLNLLESASELDEIELEEIDDSADVTGEFSRPGAQSSAGRISSPPPVPAAARERRASTPPGLAPPPAAGTSVPPPSPTSTATTVLPPSSTAVTVPAPSSTAATVRPPPPRSGMFLIEAARRLPPLPAGGAGDGAGQATQLASELRELRAHNDRLRLTVRLREDRIRELETMLREQRARADALESELANARQPQPQGDDLKRIAGIGPGFERALHDSGITTFRQIADWTPEDVERVARQLRTAPARILRGRWIERARELAGDV